MGGESKLSSLNKEKARTLKSSHKIKIFQKYDMYCYKVSLCGPMLRLSSRCKKNKTCNLVSSTVQFCS